MPQVASPLELLKDVGNFVIDTLSTEKLSGTATAKREALVQKLKLCLPETFPTSTPSSYLDMTASQSRSKSGASVLAEATPADGSEYVGADAPVVEEYYEECPESHPVSVPPREEATPIPTPQISYHELRATSIKSGPLLRSEKRFFREQFRRYWVGVNNQTLLFYEKEKDSKPASVINLVGFQARAAPNLIRDPKKKNCCFELICPGKKTSQLLARTTKDMEQWISAISQTCRVDSTSESPSFRHRQLPVIPDDNSSLETYDDIGCKEQNATAAVEDDDEIYHDISVTSAHESDNDSIYDDIATYPGSIYYNMGVETRVSPQIGPENETSSKQLTSGNTQTDPKAEQEEIYDDISSMDVTDSIASNTIPINSSIPKNYREKVLPPLPALPSHSTAGDEEEDFYDDIPAFDETASKNTKPISSNTCVSKLNKESTLLLPSHEQNPASQCEEEEDFYDDIPAFDETAPKFTKNFTPIPALSKSNADASLRPTMTVRTPLLKSEDQDEIYDDIQAYEDSVPSKTLSSFKTEVSKSDKENVVRPSVTSSFRVPKEEAQEELYDDISAIEETPLKDKKLPLRESTLSRIARECSSTPSPVSQKLSIKKETDSSNGISATKETVPKIRKPTRRESTSKLHNRIIDLEEMLGRGKNLRVAGFPIKAREESYEPVEHPKLKPKPNLRPTPSQRKFW